MGQSLLNLTFHGIGGAPPSIEPAERAVWLDEGDFRRALSAASARDDVRLSFDDGNASDVEIALPALRELGLRACFFVVATRIGEPGYLGPAELRELVAAGMSLGSHGYRHRPWRGLDGTALEEELIASRRAIESAGGTRVSTAACPFGAYDRRVLATLRRLGYGTVYTSDGGWAREGSWLQPRNSLRNGEDGAAQVARLAARDSLPSRARLAGKRIVKRWR